MEELTKSVIMSKISQLIDEKKSESIECELKKTGRVIKIDIVFSEKESFVDENGVKWIRA